MLLQSISTLGCRLTACHLVLLWQLHDKIACCTDIMQIVLGYGICTMVY